MGVYRVAHKEWNFKDDYMESIHSFFFNSWHSALEEKATHTRFTSDPQMTLQNSICGMLLLRPTPVFPAGNMPVV